LWLTAVWADVLAGTAAGVRKEVNTTNKLAVEMSRMHRRNTCSISFCDVITDDRSSSAIAQSRDTWRATAKQPLSFIR